MDRRAYAKALYSQNYHHVKQGLGRFGSGGPAMILAPRCLLRVAPQIGSSDMVMMALFGAAHAAEKFLCPIRASAVEAIGFFVIDPFHFVRGMQRYPFSEGGASSESI
jgi:hypothetical protein